MNTQDDGGPAFPIPSDEHLGMTLRDYFAAKAMQGLIGRVWDTDKVSAEVIFATWAKSAYAVADEMLKARQA